MPVVVRELGPAAFGLLALAWTVVGYFGLFDLGFGRAATQRVATLASAAGAGTRGPGAAAEVADVATDGDRRAGAARHRDRPAAVGRRASAGRGARRRRHGGEGVTVLRLLATAAARRARHERPARGARGTVALRPRERVRAPFSAALFVIPLAGVLAGWSLGAIVLGLVASRWLAAAVYGWLSRRALGRWGRVRGCRARAPRPLRRLGRGLEPHRPAGRVPGAHRRQCAWRDAGAGVLCGAARADDAAPHRAGRHRRGALSVLFAACAPGPRPAPSPACRQGRAGGGRAFRAGALIFILFAPPLLELWLGEVYAERGGLVLRILATAAFLNALVYVPFALIEGIGRPDVVARYHLAELPVYAGLLWVFTGAWGIRALRRRGCCAWGGRRRCSSASR
jgi:hypothetical protein